MRKRKKSLTDLDKKWLDIASKNALLGSFYEKAKKKRKEASCRELEKLVEEARMHEDNLMWKTEEELDLVRHTYDMLQQELRERCPDLWKKYADKETPRLTKKIEDFLRSHGIEANLSDMGRPQNGKSADEKE